MTGGADDRASHGGVSDGIDRSPIAQSAPVARPSAPAPTAVASRPGVLDVVA